MEKKTFENEIINKTIFLGLMSTHNICFYGELTKIILQLSSNILLICLLTGHIVGFVMRRLVS